MSAVPFPLVLYLLLFPSSNVIPSMFSGEEYMKYNNVVKGQFLERPNRFIAKVLIEEKEETVHVKNTGRCKELLIPGCEVWLEKAANPNRKTQYDLIAVRKSTGVLFNIDSQACNKVVAEWLETQNFDFVKPEYKFGNSRVDFYMERGEEKYLLEVKGCTLEVDGMGYFPDAPTERGVKHLRELGAASREGYHCAVAFVIQMAGVSKVLPNVKTHPEFGVAWEEAEATGVRFLMLPCHVEPDELFITANEVTL